jgi:hypothetical protein
MEIKMKRLTINQTWEQCLAMWKWISRQCKGKDKGWCENNVERLKVHWLKVHGIKDGELNYNCFLCEYDVRRKGLCLSCPAQKIDKSFKCMEYDYSYETRPRLFYAKLKELNKIRLKTK